MEELQKLKEVNLFDSALQYYIEQNEVVDFQNFYLGIFSQSQPLLTSGKANKQITLTENTQRHSALTQTNHTTNDLSSYRETNRIKSANKQHEYVFVSKSIAHTSPERKSVISMNTVRSFKTTRESVDQRHSSLYRITNGFNDRFKKESRNVEQKKTQVINLLQHTNNKREFSSKRDYSPSKFNKEKGKFASPYDSTWIEKTLEKSYQIRIQFDQGASDQQSGVRPRCRAFKINGTQKQYQNGSSKERRQDMNSSTELQGIHLNSTQAQSQLVTSLL